MKVSSKFAPITITLETKKEVELMDHILNCAFGKSLEAYANENSDILEDGELEEFHQATWEKLDKQINDC